MRFNAEDAVDIKSTDLVPSCALIFDPLLTTSRLVDRISVQGVVNTMSLPKVAQPSSAEDWKEGNEKSTSSKGLTVTFQDVGIEVHGLGEDYGSTCLSVVTDLLPSFGSGSVPTRVSNTLALRCTGLQLTSATCPAHPPGGDGASPTRRDGKPCKPALDRSSWLTMVSTASCARTAWIWLHVAAEDHRKHEKRVPQGRGPGSVRESWFQGGSAVPPPDRHEHRG